MQELEQWCGNEPFQSQLIWVVSVLLKHFKKVKGKYCRNIFLGEEGDLPLRSHISVIIPRTTCSKKPHNKEPFCRVESVV